MRDDDALRREYRRLLGSENPRGRGRDFEVLVAKMFRRAGFDVRQNPRAATPRQTDVFATMGRDHYLIEVKWLSRPANIDHADSLLSRLRRVDEHVVGVFVSASGFTPGVRGLIEDQRARPVLLLDREDVEHVLDGSHDLRAMLRLKHNHLRVHAEVLLGTRMDVLHALDDDGDVAITDSAFEFGDGTRSEIVRAGGDFGKLIFVEDLPEIDWLPTPGTPAAIDLVFTIRSQLDLIRLVENLPMSGWGTDAPRWSIQQHRTNWHGIGRASFREAITGWRERYTKVTKPHHTEQVCYFDVIEGGFYTVTADIAADRRRWVWRCNLSMRMAGIPLDLEPLQQLAHSFGAQKPVYFRSQEDKAVRSRRFSLGERVVLEQIASVVRADSDEDGSNSFPYVTGIVARNPFWDGAAPPPPPDWPPALNESEILICDLRNYHGVGDNKEPYFLWSLETTWTSDVLLSRVTADWEVRRG